MDLGIRAIRNWGEQAMSQVIDHRQQKTHQDEVQAFDE